MSEQDAREDACRDYQSSLEDLTFNSKPHINMLTILAEENVQFAKDIVILIEAQIAKCVSESHFLKDMASLGLLKIIKCSFYNGKNDAPTTEKLPVMYLMDSIVKNVGRDYLAAFAKNIVSTFVNVFEKVDENTRKSLFKLRSTWDDIFPSKKLYALDVRVNAIDPAWPVKPLPPNVNTASIHVNPKFLNKSEETPPAALPVPSAVPSRTASTTEAQKHLSQEQLIRQQLLVKQKQLLELQQKKLELELEQTKAQLVHSACSLPTKFNVAPEIPHLPNKAPHFTSIHPEKNKVPTACQPHDKPHEKSQVPTRDPRLNRGNQHSSHAKDLAHKKETKAGLSIPLDSKSSKPESNEKTHLTSKQEKKSSEKPPKRESVETDIKCKSKSPSPLKGKSPHARDKSLSIENERDPVVRKDPRLHKQVRNKADEKEEEPKERRKSIEKKEEHKSSEHRLSGNRNKVINGVVQKNDTCINSSDKTTAKPGRTGRKRSRSPKSRSPKRRERRSPKRHPRSRSPVPPLLKIGKLRPPVNKPSHVDDFTSSKREERNKRNLKLDPRDNRRQKKTSEERQMDPTTPISIKSNSEPKENLENWQGPKASKRLKTAWEETKILQNDHQGNRTPYQRHRDSWQSNKGVLSPRTPKQQQQHWLSVDANLQIPKELTSASKGELLKKANDRLASGEISQDEFLVVAHQIRQLFQYQEEKHRCNVWDSPTEDNIVGVRKKPLLSNAELTYYQHKAKLKRTQVQHQFASRDVLEPEFLDLQMEEDLLLSGREGEHGGRLAGNVCERTDEFSERQRHSSPIAGTRLHMDDISLEAHRRHEDQRELSKGLREDLTRPSFHERFPHKRPKYDEMEEPLYDENSDSRIGGKDSNQKLPSLKDIRPLLDTPPLLPGARGDSLIKGFEEPSSLSNIREKSPINARVPFDNISGNKVGAQHFEAIHGQSDDAHFEDVLGNSDDRSGFEDIAAPPVKLHGQAVGLQRFEGVPIVNQPIGLQRLEDSQDEPLDPQRFEGTPGQQLGSKRFEDVPGQPVGPQRFEGVQPTGSQRFERGVDQQQFDGSPTPPLLQQRFEGMQCQPMRHEQPMRLDAIPVQPLGPLRCEVNQPALSGNGTGSQPLMNFDAPTRQVDPGFEGPRANRFDGQPSHLQRLDVLPGQSCQKFEGRPGHQTPPRFDGPVQVQPRFDGPLQPRFDGPNRHPRFDGPNQHPRFDGPNQHPRFDGPNQHPRFDGPNQHPRFDGPNQHPRFDGPSRQPLFDGPSRQPLFDGPGRQPLFDGPNQHPRFDGPNQHPRFDGPNQHPRFDGPNQYPRFDGPNRHPRFDGPGQHPRFDGPGQHPRFDGPGQHPRFDGPGQQQHPRFDGPGQQQHPRFDGPGQQQRPRFDGPGQQQRPRFDGPGQQQHPRFDGPGQQQHPRFDGPGQQQQHPRFDGPGQQQQHPRFDGPGQQQQHPRFEGPGQQQQHPRFEGPGQQQQQQHPRFEGPGQQQHPRFEGPGQQQHPRFDLPIGHKGPRFDNVNLPQNAPPYGQTVPYGDQQNLFHGPSQGIPPQGILPQGIPPQGVPSQSMPPQGIPPQGLPSQGMLPQSVPPQGMQPQGMQFQRPEQRFDMSQGPNFPGPPGTGLQCFPNQPPRPPGPYFDDKIPNQQGPQIGNFNNLPSANIQSNQPFSTVGGLGLPASFNQQPPYGAAQGPNAGVFVQNQPGASFPYPENHLGQLDVNELFSKLLSTGILKVSQPETSTTPVPESSTQPAAEEEEEDPADNDVPDLTGFTMEDLKVRYDSIINRLYTGIQCYSCGMRFTKSQTDVYADHLDWHYRQNRTEKDVSRKITHRRWYYSLTDWIEFEEFADLEERAKSQFFERVHEEVILKTQEAAKEKEFQSVPAGPAGADEICEICQEQFEQYWDEEEEEWHLKNAMRVNEKIYHPSCYDDYKNTSSFLDSTPSPSTTLLENPLNVMLSLAKEEVTEASDTVKVKEEPMDNEAKSTCETIPLLTEIKTEPE